MALSKKLLKTFLFLLGFFVASSVSAKISTIDVCQKMAPEMEKGFPKKGKIFTALKPECIDSSGSILLQMTYQANKNNEPEDQLRERLLDSASSNLRKIVCHMKEFAGLLQIIDLRFAFKLEEAESIAYFFDIGHNDCKTESTKAIDLGSSVGLDECRKYVSTTKNKYPKKLSDKISVVELGCRKGESKPVALVYFNEVNVQASREVIAASIINDVALRKSLKSSYCSNGLTRGILNTMDISNVFKVKEAEVGEIVITIKDCD